MASQVPLRVLCLDGGGVKGLSSLYILKELMAQIRRNKESGNLEKPRSHLRPYDYFDLICGTGTGGLLAIMLGRLQYDIDTAIKKYVALASAVFETNSTEDRALFDAATLELEMRKVIKASPDGSEDDAMFEDPRVVADTRSCRTFVLASRPEGLGKAAVRMRSYATEDNDPFQAQIWQVARATSAAPTYFLPIDISGIRYGDGRIGWNNPTMEAINEANYIWPGRPIACVISVGTGLEDAIQVTTESRAPSISGVLGQLFRSLTPKQAFELAVAQYCVSCVTSCERTHGQVASNITKFGIDGPWQYVRLNVPQGMAKIGLQEWKKFHMIAALTEDYMEDINVRELKRQIAERLTSPGYYSVPASTPIPDPNNGPMERIAYTVAQRQIEGRGSPATTLATAFTMQEIDRSNALVRQQILASRQEKGPLQGEYSESSSDESGTGGNGQLKRSKVEIQNAPSLVPNAANHGRLRHPPMAKPPSPPVNIYSSLHNSVPGQYMAPRYGDDEDEDQTFNVDFNGNEFSATVLCCDYPECQSMGALQKDYLRDHYVTYHDEALIRPSMMIPHTTLITNSRSLRCSACLRKLTDENQGRTCDNCQRFQPIRNVSMAAPPGYVKGLQDTSTLSSRPWPEALDSEKSASPSGEPSGSSPKAEAEDLPPQPSFWIPPEIPEHWTSYTPSTPRRINANTGHSRTRSFSSYKCPHTVSPSVRKAREEYRRQRLYHENA